MNHPNTQDSQSQLFAEVSKLLNSTLILDELLDVILNLASQTIGGGGGREGRIKSIIIEFV